MNLKAAILFLCAFVYCVGSLGQSALSPTVGLPIFRTTVIEPEEDEEWYDDERGLSYGITIGAYVSSRKPANFYNGTCTYSISDNVVQCYTIEDILGQGVLQRPDVVNQILQNENATGGSFFFPIDAYPGNMRYNPAIMLGLNLKYNFNLYSALVFDINFARLKTVDKFSMIFTGTSPQVNQQQDTRLFDVIGGEDRISMNLGYRNGWEINTGANFYMELGGTFVGTKWTENYVRLGQLEYDLNINFIPGQPNSQGVNAPQSNFGVGYYGGTGLEFKVAGKYGFDLGFNLQRDKITIGNYSERVWNKIFLAKFTL